VARQSALKDSTQKKSATNLRDAGDAKGKHLAPNLDRLIHERMRLGIVSALAANESLTFNDLKSLMNTTDGNLSVHARKLEDGGYIACTKSFEGRLPKTEYKLTVAGRRALESYLSHMETLIHQMRNS
jgi:DNA-binding HxlR family transcriptional regulator